MSLKTLLDMAAVIEGAQAYSLVVFGTRVASISTHETIYLGKGKAVAKVDIDLPGEAWDVKGHELVLDVIAIQAGGETLFKHVFAMLGEHLVSLNAPRSVVDFVGMLQGG